MKIKHNTYYKVYYDNDRYSIWCIDNEYIYYIAEQFGTDPLIKYDKRIKYGSIKNWQEHVHRNNYKIEEMSKGDLFLEML